MIGPPFLDPDDAGLHQVHAREEPLDLVAAAADVLLLRLAAHHALKALGLLLVE